MRTRLGQVLWLIAGLLAFATFSAISAKTSGELLFGPAAVLVAFVAYIISGPPWRL